MKPSEQLLEQGLRGSAETQETSPIGICLPRSDTPFIRSAGGVGCCERRNHDMTPLVRQDNKKEPPKETGIWIERNRPMTNNQARRSRLTPWTDAGMPGQEDEKIDDVHRIDRCHRDLAKKKGATARNRKSPGSREESTPDPSEGPQEDVMLGTGTI